jgi:FtsP/CotA-like multicopper oxidase with cupredoxin domain
MELSLAMDHKKLPMSLFPDPVTDPNDLDDSAFALAFQMAQSPGGAPSASPFFIPHTPRDTAGNAIMAGHIGEVTPLGVRGAMAQSMLSSMGATLAKRSHNDPSGIGIEWFDDMPEMNRLSTSDNVRWIMRDFRSGKENMDLHWHFKKGKVYHIRIWNNYNVMHPMAHVIHFHGQRTVQIANDGVIDKNPMWKDTFLIGKGKTVDLLFEASNPGMWMGHCHLAEHAESSMMFMFQVEP